MYQIAWFLPALVSIILAGIDAFRIKRNMGGENIGKGQTVFYGGLGFCACLMLSVPYESGFGPVDGAIYFAYYMGKRGVVYTPALNLMRKKSITYYSKTTNSTLDILFGSFWKLWITGFVVSSVAALFLYREGII